MLYTLLNFSKKTNSQIITSKSSIVYLKKNVCNVFHIILQCSINDHRNNRTHKKKVVNSPHAPSATSCVILDNTRTYQGIVCSRSIFILYAMVAYKT